MKKSEWFRSRARELYHEEGEIEIDDNARVSIPIGGDDGAYVEAWVWVPSHAGKREKKAGKVQAGHVASGKEPRERPST